MACERFRAGLGSPSTSGCVAGGENIKWGTFTDAETGIPHGSELHRLALVMAGVGNSEIMLADKAIPVCFTL